jgi:hypothetical protein
MQLCELDSSGFWLGPASEYFEKGNKISGPIRGGPFLGSLLNDKIYDMIRYNMIGYDTIYDLYDMIYDMI